MRISSSWVVPAAVVVVLIVAGVGSRRSYVDSRGRPVVIYAHPPCPPSLMALYEPIWDEFKRTHPHIDFRVLHITGKYEDKIKVMYVGKIAPDIIFMYPTALPAWAELGTLVPLDGFLDDDPTVRREDYFASMLRTFTYRGKLYGLPKDASVELLYWNCDLFEACGVDPPEPNWGWAAYLEAARKLTRDTDGDGRIDQWGTTGWSWLQWIWQNGGNVVSADGRRCVLDAPQAVEAIQFWGDLVTRYKVAPTPTDMQDLGPWRLFSLGYVGMHAEMYPAVSVMRDYAKFRWDIAHVPRGPAGRISPAVGSALAITTQARHPKAAWEFIKWMTGPEGMKGLLSVEAPSCVKLARSDAFLRQPGLPASKHVAIEALEYAHPPVQSIYYQELFDTIGSELDRVWRGRSTAAEAVARATPKVNRILTRTQGETSKSRKVETSK